MSQQPLPVSQGFPLLAWESTGGQGQQPGNKTERPNHLSQAIEGSRPIALPLQGMCVWGGGSGWALKFHFTWGTTLPPHSSGSYSLTAHEWREGFRPMNSEEGLQE